MFGTVLGGVGAAIWSLFILIASIVTITMGRVREESRSWTLSLAASLLCFASLCVV